MSLLAAIGLVVLGLAVLTAGGEALVRGATTIARIAGVTPAVIGLTVVALGTSLPELVVSLLAAVRGQPDLAIGNVIGSNIFNVSATLGLAALVTMLPVHGTAVRLEWPFMFAASCVSLLLMRDGRLDRLDGGVCVVALVLFTAYMVRRSRVEVAEREREEFAALARPLDIGGGAAGNRRAIWIASAVVLLGLGALAIGGQWLVDGATVIARVAGMSERVIGLTIVAAGTGAPELATSLIAARRGHTDVAVANMIGSNIFNLLGILGVTALVQPIAVSPEMIGSDAWWMLGTALLLYPLLWSGQRLTRVEGGVLVSSYLLYLAQLLR